MSLMAIDLEACGALLLLSSSFLLVHPLDFDEAFTPAKHALEDIVDMVEKVKVTVKQLAQQTMAQQLFVEERVRSDGNSGLKQVRSYLHGTDSYFDSSYISKAAMAMHDHSNHKDMIGLGEAIAVMNGVEFRTKHNDYYLRQQDTSDGTYEAVKDIPYPDVPREVSKKRTVEEQVEEMRQWIVAFAEQNHTVRDYRKYFRPLMCFLEGGWTFDQNLVKPFSDDQDSQIQVEESWRRLQQQVRYTSYSGGKGAKEKIAFLPTTIIAINETTGEPVYAQWTYRVLCHPYSGDIPTKYFRMQDDLAYRQATQRPKSRIQWTRAARYRLSEFDTNRYTDFTLLDKIMGEIAGKDNKPSYFSEGPLDQDLYSAENIGGHSERLNTGFYHRIYRTSTAGPTGTLHSSRGFSDDMLFVAETSQERIAPMSFPYCLSINKCRDRQARFTYAIPLEIVYLTPLLTWNPYNLRIWEDSEIPTANSRRGTFAPQKALNGTSYFNNYYITPLSLFFTTTPDEADPADTLKTSVGVLDQKGVVRKTVASGTRIVLPTIKGAGRVRLRYPIFPLHVEGSAIWKELQVVKMRLENTKSALLHAGMVFLTMYPSPISGTHIHEFFLSQDQYDAAMAGQTVSATTSVENGHNHHLDLTYSTESGHLEYVRCNNENRCWDLHPRTLFVTYTPEED